MPTEKTTELREHINESLKAFETRDAVAAASAYADEGVFIDPHYPENEYHWRETIREAFDWALTNLVDQPGFTVRTFVSEGDTCAVEVDTHHVAKDGSELEFPQVFVVEGGSEGIERWRTYLPFPQSD